MRGTPHRGAGTYRARHVAGLALPVASGVAAAPIDAQSAGALVLCGAGVSVGPPGNAGAAQTIISRGTLDIGNAAGVARVRATDVWAALPSLNGWAGPRSPAARRQRGRPDGTARRPALRACGRVGADRGGRSVASSRAARAIGGARGPSAVRWPDDRDAVPLRSRDVTGLALSTASGIAAVVVNAQTAGALTGQAAACPVRELGYADAA